MENGEVQVVVELKSSFTPPGFKEWSKQKGEIRELRSKILVTDPLIQRIDEEEKKILESIVAQGIASKMISSSLIPLAITLFEERDPEFRPSELTAVVNAVFEPFILPYTMDIEEKLKRAQGLLKLPWWKLLWLKLRGKLSEKEGG